MFSWLFKLIASFTSFVLPIWASYKALETSDITAIQYLLMYWVVIGIFVTTETYLAPLLAILPLYGLFRTCFLVWLVIPQFNGSSQIYLAKIRPFLRSHDVQVEHFIGSTRQKAREFGSDYLQRALTYCKASSFLVFFGGRSDEPESHETASAAAGSEKLQPRTTNSLSESLSGTYGSSLYGLAGSLAGSLAAKLPSNGFFLANSVGTNTKGVSIPANLTAKADKLKFLQAQKDQLVQLIDRISDQQSHVQQERDDSDEEFDVVKEEDTSFDSTQGQSSAVEPAKSKSWFRFR